MPTPVLATKLYIPSPRPEVVSRYRLIEQLQGGLNRKLTLISAPAGFGKTTLLSNWVASCDRTVTWLSLEKEDNDLQRLLSYLIAALKKISINFGEGVLAALQSPQPPSTETILTTLLNEITTISDNFILVLDDYHLINTKAVDSALTFLIEHLPPQTHLVIATREDPSLPLARWRVQGQLSELRVKDLRFNTSEAAVFLNERMGLNLSGDNIVALENRTEGWIAGLQLAALSMQGDSDITRFIQAFTGNHRFVLDYLVEEVLERQPGPTRSFLLQTAMLQRLSGSLCDAITQQADGGEQLESLERSNLFVVPLDDQRLWYRYHHLFAEVLQARAHKEHPEQIPKLHLRASEWYEHNGLPADAIHHALAAEDFERAADLVELTWRIMTRSYQYATVIGWMQALPNKLIRVRPVLSAGYAWALMGSSELEAAEPYLQVIEAWLGKTTDRNEHPDFRSSEMVVVNEAEFQSLPATLATARAYQAQTIGDIASSVKYARQALKLLPKDDYIKRAIPASLLGLTYWANGDLESAHQSFSDVVKSFQMAGKVLSTIDLCYVLAEIRATQGRSREALKAYQMALQIATEQDTMVLRGTANLYIGISELYREWNNLEASAQQLQTSQKLDKQARLPDWQYRYCLAQARIKEAQKNWEGALDLIDKAERDYYRSPMPYVCPIVALKARVWLKQGRVKEALKWAQERQLFVDDEICYLREFEHITLARVLVAQYRKDKQNGLTNNASCTMDGVLDLLACLLKAAEAMKRLGSAIEILVLKALTHEVQDNISAALVPLQYALTLAKPEGFIRRFVDEGQPMAKLLAAIDKQGTMQGYSDYIGQLLAVFEAEQKDQNPESHTESLLEPLSQRELEILQLIADGRSNREISEQLFLALNTVKGHNRRIFEKLGVQRRTEAVARARELNLL